MITSKYFYAHYTMKNILEDPEVISQLAEIEESPVIYYTWYVLQRNKSGYLFPLTGIDSYRISPITWDTFIQKCKEKNSCPEIVFKDFMKSGLDKSSQYALDYCDEKGIYHISINQTKESGWDGDVFGFTLHKKTWDAFVEKYNIKAGSDILNLFAQFIKDDLSITDNLIKPHIDEPPPPVIDIKRYKRYLELKIKPTQIEAKQPVVEVKQPVAETTNVRSISKTIASVTTDDLNKITVFLEQHGIFNVSVREINKNNIRASFNLEKRGIYMLFSINVDVIPVYIGKSKNIKQRWITHHRYNEIQLLAKINQLFAVFIVEDEFLTFNDLEQSEAKLIQLLNPILNKTEILL